MADGFVEACWLYFRVLVCLFFSVVLPAVSVCYLTLEWAWLHEVLHSVGFRVLGYPSVIVGNVCVFPVPIPVELGSMFFEAFGLAVNFPYIVCIAGLSMISLLHLVGVFVAEEKFWFAVACFVSIIVNTVLVAWWVMPCCVAEWLNDLYMFYGFVWEV